jgi:hypothetical protein
VLFPAPSKPTNISFTRRLRWRKHRKQLMVAPPRAPRVLSDACIPVKSPIKLFFMIFHEHRKTRQRIATTINVEPCSEHAVPALGPRVWIPCPWPRMMVVRCYTCKIHTPPPPQVPPRVRTGSHNSSSRPANVAPICSSPSAINHHHSLFQVTHPPPFPLPGIGPRAHSNHGVQR